MVRYEFFNEKGMINETSAINTLIVVSAGGGFVAALNQNATVISISIGVAGLLMALLFHLLTIRHRNKVERRNAGEYRQKIKNEVIAELKANENKNL